MKYPRGKIITLFARKSLFRVPFCAAVAIAGQPVGDGQSRVSSKVHALNLLWRTSSGPSSLIFKGTPRAVGRWHWTITCTFFPVVSEHTDWRCIETLSSCFVANDRGSDPCWSWQVGPSLAAETQCVNDQHTLMKMAPYIPLSSLQNQITFVAKSRDVLPEYCFGGDAS